MKSNKQPTAAPPRNEISIIPSELSAEIRDKLIEILPNTDSSFMNLLSREKLIQMMNGVMGRIDKTDKELNDIEDKFLEKESFDKLPMKEKIQIYRAIERRQATMRSDAIRVAEIGSRTDFNRNFFGIQAQIMGQVNESSEETENLLTKPARHVLSEISKFVNLRTGAIRSNDGEQS